MYRPHEGEFLNYGVNIVWWKRWCVTESWSKIGHTYDAPDRLSVDCKRVCIECLVFGNGCES